MIVILMIVYVVVILIKMIPIVNGHFKMLSSSFSIDCLKYQWSTAKKSILSASRSCWEPLPGLQTAVLFLFVIMSHDMSAAHRFCNSLGCLFHIYGMKAIYTRIPCPYFILCRISLITFNHNKYTMAATFLPSRQRPQALALTWKMPHVPWRPLQSARRSALPAQHFDAPKVCHCFPARSRITLHISYYYASLVLPSTQVASSFGLEEWLSKTQRFFPQEHRKQRKQRLESLVASKPVMKMSARNSTRSLNWMNSLWILCKLASTSSSL